MNAKNLIFLLVKVMAAASIPACTRMNNRADNIQIACGENLNKDRVFQIRINGRAVHPEVIKRLSLDSLDLGSRLTAKGCFFLEPKENGSLAVLHQNGELAWLGKSSNESFDKPTPIDLQSFSAINSSNTDLENIFDDFCSAPKTVYKPDAQVDFVLHLASFGYLPGLKVTAEIKANSKEIQQEIFSSSLSLKDATPRMRFDVDPTERSSVRLTLEDVFGRSLISPICDFVVSKGIPQVLGINKKKFFPGIYVEIGSRKSFEFSIESKAPVRMFRLLIGDYKGEFVPFKDADGKWTVIAPIPRLSGSYTGKIEMEDEAGRNVAQTFSIDFGQRVFMGAPIKMVRMSPDERRVLLIDDDGSVELRDVKTFNTILQYDAGEKVQNAAINADGSRIILSLPTKTIAINALTGAVRNLAGKLSNKSGNLGVDSRNGFAVGVVEADRLSWFDMESGNLIESLSTAPAKIKTWTQAGTNPIVYSTDSGQIYMEKKLLAECAKVSFGINNEVISMSKSGSTLVYNCGDKILAQDMKAVRNPTLLVESFDTRTAAVSDDGEWIIAGSSTGEWFVFNQATGKRYPKDRSEALEKNLYFKSTISSVSISTDNQYAIVSSEDGNARLFSLKDNEIIDRFSVNKPIWHGGFVSHAKLYYTAGADNIFRLNPISYSRAVFDFKQEITDLQISPNRQFAAVAAQGKAYLIRLENEKLIETKLVHSDRINRLAFSADGRWLMSGSEDGQAKLWNIESGAILEVGIADRRPKAAVHSVFFSPVDESFGIVSDNQIAVYDISHYETPRLLLRHESWIASASFSSDGQYITTAASDNTARLFQASSGKEVGRYEAKQWVWTSRLSPNEKYFVNFNADNNVIIQSTIKNEAGVVEGLEEFAKISLPAPGQGLGFSANSAYLSITQWEGRHYLYDIGNRNLFGLTCHDTLNATATDFSLDDQYVAAGQDRDVMVYRVSDGKPVQRLPHMDNVTIVKFAGNLIVSGSRDGVLKINPLQLDSKVMCDAAE